MTRLDLRNYLRKEGFREEKITEYFKVLDYDKDKENSSKELNLVVYWVALFLTILGNIVISIALIPFLMLSDIYSMFIIIPIVAIGFGALFTFLIENLEHTEKHHIIIAGIFLPGIAIITIIFVIGLMEFIIKIMGGQAPTYNPYIVSLVYIISFMLPYISLRIKNILKKQ